jgi:hypothetical protein
MPKYPATLTYRNDDGHEVVCSLSVVPGDAVYVTLNRPTTTAVGSFCFSLDGKPPRARRFARVLDGVMSGEGYYRT